MSVANLTRRVSALRAGVARRVINPPLGIKRPGIRLFADPIQAIESDLTATVLVLAAGGSRAAIVACDLCAIPVSVVDRLRRRIAAVLDTTVEHVLINESHTHSGPALPEFIPEPPEQAALQQAYQDEMEQAVVEAAQEAGGTLQAARIGAGWGECAIAAYRRERGPDGTDHLGEVPGAPTDPSVGVVRVDDLGGRPIATLFSYGCHPVTMGPHSHVASSDFPGAARAVVEAALGGTALFLQACGGNINPVTGIGAEVDCRDNKDRIGAMLGGEVVKVAAGIRTHVRRGAKRPIDTLASVSVWPWEPVRGESESTVAVAERTLDLDFVDLPSAEKAQAIHDRWHRELAEAESGGGHHWDVAIARRFAHWSERLVVAVRDGAPRFPMPVQVLRVDDIAWLGIGAEVFFETGLAIKGRSPLAHTQVLGYSAGLRCYLPRAEDYPDGGWDIDARYAVPDLFFQRTACRWRCAPIQRIGCQRRRWSCCTRSPAADPAGDPTDGRRTRARGVARACVEHLRRELPRIPIGSGRASRHRVHTGNSPQEIPPNRHLPDSRSGPCTSPIAALRADTSDRTKQAGVEIAYRSSRHLSRSFSSQSATWLDCQ